MKAPALTAPGGRGSAYLDESPRPEMAPQPAVCRSLLRAHRHGVEGFISWEEWAAFAGSTAAQFETQRAQSQQRHSGEKPWRWLGNSAHADVVEEYFAANCTLA